MITLRSSFIRFASECTFTLAMSAQDCTKRRIAHAMRGLSLLVCNALGPASSHRYCCPLSLFAHTVPARTLPLLSMRGAER